jgi:hypothetical protein
MNAVEWPTDGRELYLQLHFLKIQQHLDSRMKITEIIEKLFDNKRGVTPERIKKAQALTSRSNLSWDDVLAAMSPEQRQQVES